MAHTLATYIFGYNPRGVKLPITTKEVAFAELDTTPYVGQMANISDSNTATWGANVAAGGSNRILARWNGTNWTVVGK